jgi:hypothetical protein
MPQVSTEEFKGLPLRVHTLLADVPLHNVWVVELPRWRARVTSKISYERVPAVYARLRSCECCSTVRFFVGRFFGWDRDPAATSWETFATSLTDADRSNSLAAAGFFRVVYRFENEQLAELIDRTAHVAALTALIETPTAYRY